jgi:hypothetical protein
MAFPTPKVYIAFDDGPYVLAPTWTDVSAYVYSANVTRGRNDDYSNVVGTAHVVLNNNSRLFDPWNTAGTYYGKLLPRRQIKIEGISNSTTYSIFRGFISGWPADFEEGGRTGTVSLECFDALALIAQEQLPDYVYDYIQTLSPYHYFPCDDPINGTLPNSAALKDYGTSNGPPATNLLGRTDLLVGNGPKLAEGLPEISCALGNYNGVLQSETGKTTAPGNYLSMAGWYKQANLRDTEQLLKVNLGWSTYVYYTKSINQFLFFVLNATTVYYATCTIAVDTNQPHHMAYNVNASGTVTEAWLDGVALTLAYPAPAAFANVYKDLAQIDSGLRQQYCVWYQSGSAVLTTARVQQIYQLSTNRVNETTAARFTRLVGYTNFPTALTSATTTPVANVSAISFAGANLANELALVNNSEGGVMYVSKSGVLTFQDRNYVYRNTKSNTAQATFATASIPYEPNISMSYSGDDLRNVYQVNLSGGALYDGVNTASVTAYGRNATTVETQLATINEAATLANYNATVGGQLLSTLSPVSVGVSAVTADWGTILGLELFERYTVTVNPATGSAFSQTQLINKITHSIVPGHFVTTIEGSARYTPWFILDKSLLDGPDLLQ